MTILLVLVSTLSATARAELGSENSALSAQLAVTESQEQAVEALARETGFSSQHARAALSLQAKASGLDEALRDVLGATYGEVYFEDSVPRLVVDVGPGASEAAVLAVLREYGVSEQSEIVFEPWNESDLREEASRLTTRLSSYILEGEAQVGIGRGGVRLTIAAGTDQSTREAVSDMAIYPRTHSGGGSTPQVWQNAMTPTVQISDEPRFRIAAGSGYAYPGDGPSPLIGGFYWANTSVSCTLGFEAGSPVNSETYFITAGHCTIGSYEDLACHQANNRGCRYFGWNIGGFMGSGGDAGVVADVSKEWSAYPAFIDWDCCGYTLPVDGAKHPAVGEFVCHTGAGTASHGLPGTTCGEVKEVEELTPIAYPSGTTWVTLDRAEGPELCGFKGDSGGPVFLPYIAYGVGIFTAQYTPSGTEGTCGQSIYFSDLVNAAKFLGVYVDIA